MENYFIKLNDINVNEHTEKKGNLTYLSWAWAWAEVKKAFPDATYTVYEDESGTIYHTDGKTCWVKTGVTVAGIEHIEYLPVMDFKNKSITLEAVTSVDVNKSIQRSLTKACARHGLGLYIYAGEDLPESETPEEAKAKQDMKDKVRQAADEKKANEVNAGFAPDKVPTATLEQVRAIEEYCFELEQPVEGILTKNNIKSLSQLTEKAAESMIKKLAAMVEKMKGAA